MIIKEFYSKGLLLAAIAIMTVSCSDSKNDDDGTGGGDETASYTELIATYVDNVVIPTYADMKNKAWVLNEKVSSFKENQTQANLDAICVAWKDVRAPWEKTEAFLFGPCGDMGLDVDPNIDTWPFDMVAFENLIAGSAPLTLATVSHYDETIRGFHTIEYLVFNAGNPRSVASNPMSDRELAYLDAATQVLRNDCIRVWTGWRGLSNLDARDQEAIEEMEAVDYWDVSDYLTRLGANSYADVFKGAKRPYTSEENVVEEIIDGITTIALEVAENKIALPASDGDVNQVESQFALNSLTDFTNNIISIENAYNGTLSGTKAVNSLASFVASKDDALDEDIRNAIANAKAKINAITAPFRNNLNDTSNINAAVEACTEVERLFNRIKTLL